MTFEVKEAFCNPLQWIFIKAFEDSTFLFIA